ncbi:hypothetical protein MPH_08094 [Macrophomina phaseolina MS6]|uniref:Uncharacterized protein n=1 Tax=Macrophomina phaseolina (strain MS6) TaxID=1126212 RepID=K2RX71_MACPH|nr:hypothetical protein MPH_08094 [Macrophomina phaseolina MS6]
MKHLHAHNVGQELFWPSQAPPLNFAIGDSQEWMSHLQNILDSVCGPRSSHANVLYPRVFHAGEDWYFDNKSARIAALVEDRLTIIVPPPAATHIIFIDIPFDNILTVTIDVAPEVHLRLGSQVHSCAYTVNANLAHTKEVILEFGDRQEAEEAMISVQSRCSATLASSQHLSSKLLRSSSVDLIFDGSRDSEAQESTETAAATSRAANTLRRSGAGPSKSAESNGNTQAPDDSGAASKSDKKSIGGRIAPQKGQARLPRENLNVFDFPEESSGPDTLQAEPKKAKASKRKFGRPKKNHTSSRKRKDEATDDHRDSDFRPTQKRKSAQETSTRMTRSSKASNISDAEGSYQQRPNKGTDTAQARPNSPARQPTPQIPEYPAQTEVSQRKVNRLRKSRPQPDSQARSSSRRVSERVSGQHNSAKRGVEEDSSDGKELTFGDQKYASDAPMPTRYQEPGLNMPEFQMKPGVSQEDAMVVSSDHSWDSASSNDQPRRELEVPVKKAKVTNIKKYTAAMSCIKPVLKSSSSKVVRQKVPPETNDTHGDAASRLSHAANPTRVIRDGCSGTNLKVLSTSETDKSQPIDESLHLKPRIVVQGESGPQNQGRRPGQKTPVPVTPLPAVHSSTRSGRRNGPDVFSEMLNDEEALSTGKQQREPLLPRKRPAEDNLPIQDDKHLLQSPIGKNWKQTNRPTRPSGPVQTGGEVSIEGSMPMDASYSSTGEFQDESEDDIAPPHIHTPVLPGGVPQQSQYATDLQLALMENALKKPLFAVQEQPPSVNRINAVDLSHDIPAQFGLTSPVRSHREDSSLTTIRHHVPARKPKLQHSHSLVTHHQGRTLPGGNTLLSQETRVHPVYTAPGAEEALRSEDTQRAHRFTEPRPKCILSSNKKKVPEHPHADSKAITTYASITSLKASQSLQTPARPPTDPFNGVTPVSHAGKDESRFVRMLRKATEKHMKSHGFRADITMAAHDEDLNDDNTERTIANMLDDDMEVVLNRDRSTSEESLSTAEEDLKYCTEEMMWEASLKPHQRDMFDVLTRVSRVSSVSIPRYK